MPSVPPTFRRVTACQPFNAIDSAGTKYWPPALLTRTSRRPNHSRTASTIAAHPAASRTSPDTHAQPSPSPAHASSKTSARRPASITEAPHASSSRAVALPRPVPPPVTRTTCPSSRPEAKISECIPLIIAPDDLAVPRAVARPEDRGVVAGPAVDDLAALAEARLDAVVPRPPKRRSRPNPPERRSLRSRRASRRPVEAVEP